MILSYNGKYLLDESVSSYLNNKYSDFDVVVIDNGSTDGTKEYVESKWNNVKVLRTDVCSSDLNRWYKRICRE